MEPTLEEEDKHASVVGSGLAVRHGRAGVALPRRGLLPAIEGLHAGGGELTTSGPHFSLRGETRGPPLPHGRRHSLRCTADILPQRLLLGRVEGVVR